MCFCLSEAETTLVMPFPDLLQDPRHIRDSCIRWDFQLWQRLCPSSHSLSQMLIIFSIKYFLFGFSGCTICNELFQKQHFCRALLHFCLLGDGPHYISCQLALRRWAAPSVLLLSKAGWAPLSAECKHLVNSSVSSCSSFSTCIFHAALKPRCHTAAISPFCSTATARTLCRGATLGTSKRIPQKVTIYMVSYLFGYLNGMFSICCHLIGFGSPVLIKQESLDEHTAMEGHRLKASLYKYSWFLNSDFPKNQRVSSHPDALTCGNVHMTGLRPGQKTSIARTSQLQMATPFFIIFFPSVSCSVNYQIWESSPITSNVT